jgi:hypothetical protein
MISPLMAAEPILLIDAKSNTDNSHLESAMQVAEMEFADGNFGSTSFLCEYLEKNKIDDPKYKLMWAASQSRIGNWNKAEQLYLAVAKHKKATKQQKSLAYVYLSKQQTDAKTKEAYADMATTFAKDSLVTEMVSEIYRGLMVDALTRSDVKKAEYYKQKYSEFMKTSAKEKKDETKVGNF